MTSTPTPDTPGPVDDHRVTDDQDPLDARLTAWLDDPKAPTRPEPETGAQGPAVGTIATEAAVERALAHEGCGPPDPSRTRGVLLQVTGNDNVTTLQTIEPGLPLGCIVREMGNDPRVLYVIPMGYAKEYPELPNRLATETENHGVIARSEVPGLQVTWDAPIDAPRQRRRWWTKKRRT